MSNSEETMKKTLAIALEKEAKLMRNSGCVVSRPSVINMSNYPMSSPRNKNVISVPLWNSGARSFGTACFGFRNETSLRLPLHTVHSYVHTAVPLYLLHGLKELVYC